MLKVAKVTQTDLKNGLLKVMIPEDNTETNWISMLSTEYQIPDIGAMVMVLFDNKSYTEGICLGEYYSNSNPPAAVDSGIYYKRMGKDVVLKYSTEAKVLEIFAGSVNIYGNLTVSGNIKANKIEQGGGKT